MPRYLRHAIEHVRIFNPDSEILLVTESGVHDAAIANFRPLHAEVVDVVSVDGPTVVTAQVSGTFPGSPIQLRYRFTLRDGLIAAVTIAP
jgi:hypothetical protein